MARESSHTIYNLLGKELGHKSPGHSKIYRLEVANHKTACVIETAISPLAVRPMQSNLLKLLKAIRRMGYEGVLHIPFRVFRMRVGQGSTGLLLAYSFHQMVKEEF